jgi:hypothetical protein
LIFFCPIRSSFLSLLGELRAELQEDLAGLRIDDLLGQDLPLELRVGTRSGPSSASPLDRCRRGGRDRPLPYPKARRSAVAGKLLLLVDMDVADVVDVDRELDPRAPEGNDPGAVQPRSVRMDVLFEDDPGERCSWLTTTRSAPLMMKVPRSVRRGRSPR